jgi:PST family polysaccharide transporter
MIGATMDVARILSPNDYGVMAMAAPVLAFVLLFQDLGFSGATVQAREITPQQSTTLFWINVFASIFVASALLVLSPAVGRFYGDARVGYVTAASALPIVLSSLGIQHLALLARALQFRSVAIIVVCAALANAVVTIVSAMWLHNYWALFLGILAGSTVQVCVTWFLSEFRPATRARWSEARPLIGFGGYVVLFGLLNFLNRNVDSVLLGRVWGAGQVGLYDRSQKLMLAPLQLVNSPLSRVMLPILSRLLDEPKRYRGAYLFALRGLLLATIPVAATAVSASDDFILVLLGPAWKAAAPIFLWLSLATLYQPFASSTGWLFLSSGRAKEYAAWAFASNFVILFCFVVGLKWGAIGIARSYVIGGSLLVPFLLYWATKNTAVRATQILALLPPFVIAAVGTLLIVKALKGVLDPLPLIIVALPSSYLLAFAVQYALPDGRIFLAKLQRLLGSLFDHRSLLEGSAET